MCGSVLPGAAPEAAQPNGSSAGVRPCCADAGTADAGTASAAVNTPAALPATAAAADAAPVLEGTYALDCGCRMPAADAQARARDSIAALPCRLPALARHLRCARCQLALTRRDLEALLGGEAASKVGLLLHRASLVPAFAADQQSVAFERTSSLNSWQAVGPCSTLVGPYSTAPTHTDARMSPLPLSPEG